AVSSALRAFKSGWRRARPRRLPRQIPEQPPEERAELLVLALLAAATLLAVAFVVVYAVDRLRPHQTQLLGLLLGLAFAALAAASLVLGKRLVPDEEISEPYPEPENAPEQEELEQLFDESGARITRKRLLLGAGGAAGAAMGAALIAPAVSLGPILDTGRLRRSPWRAGTRLVDETGRPLRVREIADRTFYTAFPEGAGHDSLASPLVVVRLDPDELDLPDGRAGWAPDGVLAYSKICTHAGCAIALYRTPHYEPTAPKPALVCPCHYSTFDPAKGGGVLFGPAGRPLPQLPLSIDSRGVLRAAGNFSGAVGPSWWGVRNRSPKP
ncbi:MAG: ubiquinol-cytochrome c reductase iron-sulfur subunit, partial [Gaiellaceae bacterium]